MSSTRPVTLPTKVLRHALGAVLVVVAVPAQYLLFIFTYTAVVPMSRDHGPILLAGAKVVQYVLIVAILGTVYLAPSWLKRRNAAFLPYWALVAILSVWALGLLPMAWLLLITSGPLELEEGRALAYSVARYGTLIPLLALPITLLLISTVWKDGLRRLRGLIILVVAFVVLSSAPIAVLFLGRF